MRYLVVILFLASPALAGEPEYCWRSQADAPEWVYLYVDGKPIGAWCYLARHYRPFDGKNWGLPTDTAPVQPPEQRVLVITQQRPVVTSQQSLAPLRLRGPLRVRLGTAIGQAVTDLSVNMIEEVIPRAIADSVARGQYQTKVQFSVTRSAQPSEGRTTPPSPSQPTRSPQRQWTIPRQ